MSDPLLALTIPGKPRPQGSMTLARNPATGQEFAKYGAETVNHRNLAVGLLRDAWGQADPLAGAVAVRILASFERPKAHYGTGRNAGTLKDWAPHWHTQAPDADKLARLILDALTIAGVYRDDSQACVVRVEKLWSPGRSGTLVEVFEIGEGNA
jgi:Holliday junction resolvase RusA-like endonuclease